MKVARFSSWTREPLALDWVFMMLNVLPFLCKKKKKKIRLRSRLHWNEDDKSSVCERLHYVCGSWV